MARPMPSSFINAGARVCARSDAKLTTQVRMETPVIYFYANRRWTSRRRCFPKGKITEWYPQARGVGWRQLGQDEAPRRRFQPTRRLFDNHYYAARETDSALHNRTNDHATEQEKFLFYRGVGNFDLPLSVTLENNRVTVRNTGRIRSRLIVFDNRDGKVGFQTIDNLSAATNFIDRPTLIH